MADHPASDPAKPGSKLDSIQKLGRRGGIRGDGGRALETASAAPAVGGPEPVTGAPVPHTTVKRATRKAVNRKVKSVTRAKAVLKKAETKAKTPKAVKKPGPPAKVGTPWKEAGVSKAKYYRDRSKSDE